MAYASVMSVCMCVCAYAQIYFSEFPFDTRCAPKLSHHYQKKIDGRCVICDKLFMFDSINIFI